jgi:pimeloyl-ACP methyl ester carboxylesterase
MHLVRLSGIGHTPHREQPDLVLELIQGFLKQLPAEPPAP